MSNGFGGFPDLGGFIKVIEEYFGRRSARLLAACMYLGLTAIALYVTVRFAVQPSVDAINSLVEKGTWGDLLDLVVGGSLVVGLVLIVPATFLTFRDYKVRRELRALVKEQRALLTEFKRLDADLDTRVEAAERARVEAANILNWAQALADRGIEQLNRQSTTDTEESQPPQAS